MNKPFNPPTVMKPAGAYCQGMEIPAGARLVLVAGQGGITVDGKLLEGFAAQYEQALRNVVAVLEASNMTPRDLVRLTTYIVAKDHPGMEMLGVIGPIRARVLGDALPTGLMAYVTGLARPGMLVEIDGMAAKTP